MLSFEKLSEAYAVYGSEGLTDGLGEWVDQEVVLRGFVTQTEDGIKILTPEPKISTCSLEGGQVASHVVLADWPGTSPASRAINVRGRFSVATQEVEGELQHCYRMDECCVDSSLSAVVAWLILLPAFGLAVVYYVRNLFKRLPKKSAAKSSKAGRIV